MKKLLFIMLAGINISAMSQQVPEYKTRFGFILGLNQTYLTLNSQPDSLSIQNNFGFNLGILMDHQLTNHFYVSPRVGLGFYNGEITLSNQSDYYFGLTPTTVDLALNIKYVLHKSTKGFYVFSGPRIQFPFKNNNFVTEVFGFPLNYTLDIGTGFNIKFRNFDLSPEIKYSFALQSISVNAAIPLVRFNSLSLVFNLQG